VTPDAARITDSRRVPGPNLLWDRPGVVLDVVLPDDVADGLIAAWRREIERLLAAVGWGAEATTVRRFPGGASLAMSAPVDCLFTATEINEWAFESAQAELEGTGVLDLTAAADRLRLEIEAERKPRLLALRDAARAHGVSFLMDPHLVSVGTGAGSLTWKIEELPLPESVDWSEVYDVPAVLITGSNGKTTSTRLLTAVLTSAGRVVGMCCTDSVIVGGELISRGDWAGPGGARMVLRDRRVEVAVLETARGGILRRGLAIERATAAIVTNVAEDHFGEFGIHDLAALAEAKLVVGRALGGDGLLVLNADDPVLVSAASRVRVPLCWFSLDRTNPVLESHIRAGGAAVWVEEGEIRADKAVRTDPKGLPRRRVAAGGSQGRLGRRTAKAEETDELLRSPLSIAQVADVPITLGGAATHNVANALGVVALALGLGVDPAVIGRGLTRFKGSSSENPGRLNLFELGGATAVADFAHNPHGMDALVRMANALPSRRRLLVLGQAGDRDDSAIDDLTRSAWAFRPDRIILKEMEPYRRGRPVGEVTGLMRAEFVRLGARPDSITGAPSEFAALLDALRWAERGDLLLLPLHAERERGLELLERLQRDGWRPGDEVVGAE
jgi:UDP-N-acetylmuramyl tripeptide synthase